MFAFGAGVGDLSPLCSESATPVLSLTFFSHDRNSLSLGQTNL